MAERDEGLLELYMEGKYDKEIWISNMKRMVSLEKFTKFVF